MDDNQTPTTPLASQPAVNRLVRRSPRPMALEQRFVFDGAGGADVVEAVASQPAAEAAQPVAQAASEPLAELSAAHAAPAPLAVERNEPQAEPSALFTPGEDHPTLNEATASAAEQIRNFFAEASDAQLFELFRGGQTSPSEQWTTDLAQLRASIAAGTASIGISLLDNSALQGALAAYAAEGRDGTPEIFVNRDWLGAMDGRQVSQLLVEEFGHHVDQLLNRNVDTAGDEGQRFAAAVSGLPADTLGFASDNDHGTLQVDSESLDVEFATLTFVNAYEVNTATTPAGKESNSHDFKFTDLGQVTVNDATNSRFFSGNDVSATAVTIGDNTYYGWISRPIKSGGIVRGFYFWTDADFTSLDKAQQDGNQDGDSNVADNRGFLLVVDQAWFSGLGWKNTTENLKNVGSSSDRVDSALNAFVDAPVAPVAVADSANGTPGTAGGAAQEAGSGTPGNAAIGNVLSNDTGGDGKQVTAVGTSTASQSVNAATTSANGTLVSGRYGTLTLGADGSYRYVVNDADPQVQALRTASDTLTDTFTYRMMDASGATSTTTLSVTIQGANDAPVASSDYDTAKESIATTGQYSASDTSGSQALGNVLSNDTDVDRYGESRSVVTLGIEGAAIGTTSSTTTFNTTLDANDANSIKAGSLVFRLNPDGSRTQLFSANNVAVTVTGKSGTGQAIGFTFSDPSALFGITRFSVEKNNGFVDGTINSTTVSTSTSLALSGVSGNLAVGMTVNGTGLATAPTITGINYDADGQVSSVVLSAAVGLTNQSLTFSSSRNAGVALTGQYGELLLNADGTYIYTPTANNPALSEGQSAVESFQYTMRDASGATSSASLHIKVFGSGSNDPNAVADLAEAFEQGGFANGDGGVNPRGNLLDNDTTPSGTNQVVSARPVSSATDIAVSTGTEIAGLYGKLILGTDGSYSYQVDNSSAAVQALRDGSDTLTDTFIYTIRNGLGRQDSATLTVTLRGANDAPVAADTVATAIEAGGVKNASAGYNPAGNVLDPVTDVNDVRSELQVTSVRLGTVEGSGSAGTLGSALAGLYGSLTLAADGSWTYVVDNSHPGVQALNPGQTLVEHFNYTVTDRSGSGLSDTAVLTITLEGAADTVAVNSLFVNEASPYAVFTVSGSAGVAVRLELSNSEGLPSSDNAATLFGADADIGGALEYFNGNAWTSYQPGSSVLIPNGDKLLVRVAVNQDNVHEGNESFTLIAVTGGNDRSIGIGTINDEGEGEVYLAGNSTGTPDSTGTLDDDRPTLRVDSIQVGEGEFAQFVVRLDKPSTQPISFSPVLASGTASVGTDTAATEQLERLDGAEWVKVDGPVSIAPGELSVRLRIATLDDSAVEGDETFGLRSGPISGTVTNPAGAEGVATIEDNDTQAPSNRAPVAADDTLEATEDTPVTFTAAQLLGNDSDLDSNTLTIASVTSGTGGTAVLNADGTVTFTPSPDFSGEARFSYSVSDGSLTSNSATVTVSVTPVNDAPVPGKLPSGEDDLLFDASLGRYEITTPEDTPRRGSVSGHDADGDSVSYAVTTAPGHGVLSLDPDTGSYTYTPHANFNGADSFVVTLSDGNGGTSTATVAVTVTPVNDAPVAVNDTLAATEDTPVTYTAAQLLGNDSDLDSDPLTIASVTSGTGGTAVLNADGTVTFTPDAHFNGVATFSYTVTDGNLASNVATVTVNVGAVNDAPVAVNDTLAATEDTPVIFSAAQLLSNDSDLDGDLLTIASVTSGTGGTAVLNLDGTVTFTPSANFNGVATFSYTVTDGSLTSNTATVTVNVGAVNDAPMAVNDNLAATEDTPIIFTAAQLLGNDSDVDSDTLTIASVTSGTGGTAVLNLDGTVTFTPNPNFNGVANFSYTVTDGSLTSNTATVTVNVGAVNDAPVAVNDTLAATEDTPVIFSAAQLLGNDSDLDGDTLSIAAVTSGTGGTAVLNADGTITFTPDAHFNGVATFSYTISDGNLASNVATVTVNVGAVNDAPVAVNDTLAATEDTPVIFSAAQLLGNDSDLDGDTLSISAVTSGTGGTAVLNADGTITFTPDAHFNGVATFSYTISDGNLASNVATVTVNVGAVNDAPVAVNDTLAATEDTPVTYTAAQLLGNDSDLDGDTLTIASVTSGTGGTAVLNLDGTVTFTPDAHFNGVATFSYTVTDGNLASNVATVTVNVGAVNDAPVAVNDTLAATEDTPVTCTAAQLLGNDSDLDGDTLSIASVTSGTGGTAVLNLDGTVTFTPNPNFNGVATFSYTITDGNLVSNVATVTVNVGAVNDAPVAVNDTLVATEDTPVTYTAAQLLGNDTDVDSNTLTIASVTSGTGGTAVLNADGTVTFTPDAHFNGAATFSYTITDGNLVSNVATVTVNVGAVNDAPVAVNDTLAATEDTPIIFTAAQLLGNDTDVDSNMLTIASVTSGTGGTAVLNLDGTVTFTPNAHFNGAATFSYTITDGNLVSNVATVTVNVGAVNDAPVAVNDTLAATEDTPVLFSAAQLLSNDSDLDSDPLTIAAVTSGTGGTTVLNLDGTVTFTPSANFNGVATFSYTVTDGNLTSNTATVAVNVAAVNDAAAIGGTATGVVYEDLNVNGQGNLTTGGVLTVTDPDAGEAAFQPNVTSAISTLGTLAIDTNGTWSYSVPNSAVQYLKSGESKTETFTVNTVDGTTSVINVTLIGADEPAPPVPIPLPVAPLPPAPPVAVAEPAPAPQPVVAFDSTLSTATAPAGPVALSVVASASQRIALEPANSSAAWGDVYTSRAGFPIVVIEAAQPTLAIYRGVADQYADAGSSTSFAVPYDAFAHTDPNEKIVLSASLANGEQLPGWLVFNPQSGKFELKAPAGEKGELTVKVVARDGKGREVSVLFRITLGERKAAGDGRASLSDQLRLAGKRSGMAFVQPADAGRVAAAPKAS